MAISAIAALANIYLETLASKAPAAAAILSSDATCVADHATVVPLNTAAVVALPTAGLALCDPARGINFPSDPTSDRNSETTGGNCLTRRI